MPVVIVTGASSGIGRVTAARLAGHGTTVVLAARRADRLDRLATAIAAAGGTAVAVPTDVRDPAAITALVERAVALTGRLDGLVNNAGRGRCIVDPGRRRRGRADDRRQPDGPDPADAHGRADHARAALGAIVNIGSVAGEVGIGGTYSATKFALRGMTDSVRRELAGTGIGVTLVEPGFIATAGNARIGRPGPEIVAAAVERALARPRRRMVVPLTYRAAITLSNALPFLTDRVYAGRAGR